MNKKYYEINETITEMGSYIWAFMMGVFINENIPFYISIIGLFVFKTMNSYFKSKIKGEDI